SRKNPSRGTNQLSKARLSRSEKRKIANSASRGEMKARRTTRQAMGRRYPLGRPQIQPQFTDSLSPWRNVSGRRTRQGTGSNEQTWKADDDDAPGEDEDGHSGRGDPRAQRAGLRGAHHPRCPRD